MGLFDKAFKSILPSVQSSFTGKGGSFDGGGSSGDWSSPTSFSVTGAAKKVSEAADNMVGTFGGLGSFTKLAANLPSIEDMTSKAILEGDEIADDLIGDLKDYLYDQNENAVTAGQLRKEAGVQARTVAHKVCLREIGATGSGGASSTKTTVYFDVLPEMVESHTAEYEAIAPSQFPGAFQKYKGTSTTQWTINAMFVSRTSEEATQNYDIVQRLRGWTRPFFGKRTGESYPAKLGAPPPVLMLSGLRNLIGPVPVVITSLNWNWPKDVDYIATTIVSDVDGNLIPFPTVLQIPIQLVESYSVDQFNSFSLSDYRIGNMPTAFNTGGGNE